MIACSKITLAGLPARTLDDRLLPDGTGDLASPYAQVFPFTSEEITELLEVANIALRDAEIFDSVGDQLDLTDDYMQAMREKLGEHLGC